MSVKWCEYSNGLIGEFPCGLSIFITSLHNPELWTVRFGTTELHKKFVNIEEAKWAGMRLARKKLVESLDHLPDETELLGANPEDQRSMGA